MGEFIRDTLIDWSGLRFVGWFFKWLLRMQLTRGIEFYPKRRILDKKSTLQENLNGVKTAYAFSVRGDKIINGLSHPERHFKKLLLPHPESRSLRNLQDTTNRPGVFSDSIRSVSHTALNEKNIETRWYSEFVGYSLLIAEPYNDNGFVQIEWVLPYSIEHLDRPSVKIYKKQQPDAFEHFLTTFEAMWDKSKKPTPDDLKQKIANENDEPKEEEEFI